MNQDETVEIVTGALMKNFHYADISTSKSSECIKNANRDKIDIEKAKREYRHDDIRRIEEMLKDENISIFEKLELKMIRSIIKSDEKKRLRRLMPKEELERIKKEKKLQKKEEKMIKMEKKVIKKNRKNSKTYGE